MSDQKFVYNTAPYKKEHEAKIIGKSTEFGIKLDEPIFYHRGGGQPGDIGTILVNGVQLKIIDRICICSSVNSYDKICVVENLADMWVIDSANIYKGHYHILGGTLNSNENYQQKNLLIESLVKWIKKNNLKEVIIATSATVEGQTTAYYIEDSLKKTNVKVSRLAQGLPVGGEIENLDDGTLFSAFKNRSGMRNSSD